MKHYSWVGVGPVMLCDQAFPVQSHIMKPYPEGANLSLEQTTFNHSLSGARRVVENAFGRLKAGFRILLKCMECDNENCSRIIRACCVLNNLCEQLGIDRSWLVEVHRRDRIGDHPDHTTAATIESGAEIRNALASYLHGLIPPPISVAQEIYKQA